MGLLRQRDYRDEVTDSQLPASPPFGEGFSAFSENFFSLWHKGFMRFIKEISKEALKTILTAINNRSFHIKNAIEFAKFLKGYEI